MTRLPRLIAVALLLLLLASCGGDDGPGASPTRTPVPGATRTRAPTPARPTLRPTATPLPAQPTPSPISAISDGPANQPLGFPIEPTLRLGRVAGEPGARRIEWGAGPDALTYSRDQQPSAEADVANASGWNCRTHEEYEGLPAVDWYIPVGTPVYATMDGAATLYARSITNDFDRYGVDREPYLGNPDRARAPTRPFPGPSAGLGVYVEVDSGAFLTSSGHLDLARTAAVIPRSAFLAGWGPDADFAARFTDIADRPVAIAQWQVRRGDVIGVSGDSGYSEAPHLHYTVQPAGSQALLCPTAEAGFPDNGWLFR